jgi:hypothetical protein
MRRWLRFNVLLWCAALAAIVWLLTWPLIRNSWAESHWKQTPCRVAPDSERYFYEVDGYTYNTTRRDFWQTKVVWSKAHHPLPFGTNGICWVNPRDPEDAVRFLDASRNLTNAGGRIAGSALLLTAVFLVTHHDARRAKRKKAQ